MPPLSLEPPDLPPQEPPLLEPPSPELTPPDLDILTVVDSMYVREKVVEMDFIKLGQNFYLMGHAQIWFSRGSRQEIEVNLKCCQVS